MADPEFRGDLDDLFDACADALGEVSDAGGGCRSTRSSGRSPRCRPRSGGWSRRAAAGALAWAALAGLSPEPAVPAPAAALLVALLVALLPRAGWLAAAAGVTVLLTLGTFQRPGAALLVAALCAGPPLLLRADGRAWSLPFAAPLLGLAGLAGAYPALAGRAPRWTARFALGALGAWTVLLAEPLLGRTLVFGTPAGMPDRPGFDGAPGITAGDVIAPLCSSGALLLAVIWGVAALVLPWLVRGRSLQADIVGAAMWSAGTAAAVIALGEWLGDRAGQAEPRGAVLGAIAAGALALGLAHARRRTPPAGDP